MSRLSSALAPARSALAIAVTLALAATGAVASVAAHADARPVVQVSAVTQADAVAPLVPSTSAFTGTVKNSKGAGIVGATVSAWSFSEEEGYSEQPDFETETGSAGAYTLAVAPGTYLVKFSAPSLAQPLYVDEYWKNASDIWYASDLTVEEGETLSKINATLDNTSVVTGKVTKAGGVALTPSEIADIALTVCAGDSYDDEFYTESDCVGTSTIAADGTYKISGFGAGTYTVFLSSGSFLDSYYPSSHYPADAKSFTIKSGATVKNKNFTVSTGAAITGVISTNLNILSGATITAYLQNTEEQCCEEEYEQPSKTVKADATGHYSLGGLWPGDYKVYAHGAEYAAATYSGEWFDNTYTESQARVLALADLSSTATADVQLEASSTFWGNVVVKNTDTAAVGASIDLYRLTTTRNRNTEWTASTIVGADGSFDFGPVTPGRYAVLIGPSDENPTYVAQYYGARPGETIHEATLINLDPAGGLGFTMQAVVGGVYTGTVVGTDGPLEGVYVGAESDSTDDLVDSYGAETDENGHFELVGLNFGAYTVSFDPSELGYDDEGEYTGIHYVHKEVVAPPVVEQGLPTDLGEIALDEGAVIRGVVTGPNGKVVKNASLGASVLDAQGDLNWIDYADTDSKGRYEFSSLPTGELYISVESSYPAQFIGGTDDSTMATPVVITAPGTTRTQNISLFAGGSISGTVRDAAGRVVANVGVSASKRPLESTYADFAIEDPDDMKVTSKKGTYTLPGLTPGSYDVTFGGIRSLYGNSPYLSTSKTTYLGGTSGVTQNATVTRGTKISGTVSADGEPLPLVLVIAYPVAGGVFDPYGASSDDIFYSLTDDMGEYALYAAPGEYVLQFIDFFGDNGSTYYGNTPRPLDSTHVVVGSTPKTGIDGTLAAFTGSVTATLAGDYDERASSFVALLHTPLGGGEQTVTSYFSNFETEDVFPITGLEDGDYLFYVDAMDDEASLVGYEGEFTIDADHRSVDLGQIELGERQPIEWIHSGNNGALPSVSNPTPHVGDIVAADPGEWTDDVNGFSYQWLRNGKPIIGALDATYAVQPGDAGKKLSVRVLPSDDDDVLFGEIAISAETDAVIAGTAANLLTVPTVTGTPRVGQTLTANSGEWNLPALSFSFEWVRTTDGVNTVVGSKSSYTLTTKDVAADLSVRITASRPGFATATTVVPVAAVQPSTALTQSKKSSITLTGDTYTVSNGTWKPSGATFTYQWSLDGDAVEGATGTSFVPAGAGRVSVVITASKTGYASTSVEYLASGLTWVIDPALREGWLNQVGREVGIDLSVASTTPAASGYAVQWFANGKAVKGATKTTFTPTKAGQTITVSVRGIRGAAVTTDDVVLELGTTVAASGLIDVSASLSSETAAVGRPITATIDLASPVPTSVKWQWLRSTGGAAPVAIAKATKASYTPTLSDADSTLSVVATVERSGYTKTTVELETSPVAITAPLNATAPSLPLTVNVGTKVAANPGTWDLVGLTLAYQWAINGTPVGGATSATYLPRAEDADEALTVTVTATKAGHPAASPVTSNAVTVQLAKAPTATKAASVTVSGKKVTSASTSKTLTATAPAWSVAGVTTSYQWERFTAGSWSPIAGANSATLDLSTITVTAGDKVRVGFQATRAGYETTAVVVSPAVTIK